VNFDGTNGTAPNSIIQGSDGNFYRTTFIGGTVGPGTVFKMTPSGTLTTLHSFSGPDGGGPGGPISVGGLLKGQDGNLYGTTFGGGGPALAGTVFMITTGGALTTLYVFQNQGDGYEPTGALAQGPDGTLYGTTFEGGGGCGSVYSVTPGGAFSSLFGFCSGGTADGVLPLGGLVRGADGNFYGTTTYGGVFGNGEVFQVTPGGALTVLYSFGTTLGQAFYPITAIQGSDGNFYGATNLNGLTTATGTCPGQACGTIFKLTPNGALTTLHVFSGTDGVAADALVQGTDGNLYGTTGTGGTGTTCKDGCGTVFKMTLSGAFTTLYDFTSTDVSAPSGIVMGMDGALYGTAIGQANSNGVIYRLALGSSSTTSEPSISPNGVVSASDYGKFPATAPGSQIEIYGNNLARDTRGWSGTDFDGLNAPTSLDGTFVTIGGKSAFVDYISPGQVNVIVPSGVPTGIQQLTVTTAAGTSGAYNVTVNAFEPGLLAPAAFKIGGTQYVAAFFPDTTPALPVGAVSGLASHPAKPGDIVTLYGIGFGPVIPAIPAGQLVEASNTLASSLEISALRQNPTE
jgi:uncharacterized protein (TIGR03437 family)